MIDASSVHLFNESSAWNIALGIGFAAAAVWPRLSSGMLPTSAVFVGVLVLVSVVDLLDGQVDLARIGSHTLVAVGMMLLLLVRKGYRSRPGPEQVGQFPRADRSSLRGCTPEQRRATRTGAGQTKPR